MAVAGAIFFTVSALAAMGLHIAVILGAPWGFMTMGGRHSGVLPPRVRIASVAQVVLLLALILAVTRAAGLFGPPSPGTWGPWVAVAVGALASVLNTITPSRRERYFGIPVSLALLAGSLAVALGG